MVPVFAAALAPGGFAVDIGANVGVHTLTMARIVGNRVVIEEDMTDKKLVDALLQRGILRDQIILAYEGEPIPDAAQFELDA